MTEKSIWPKIYSFIRKMSFSGQRSFSNALFQRRDVGAGPLERGPRGLQERQADRPARRGETAQPGRHLHPQHGHLRQLMHAGQLENLSLGL